MYVKKKVCFLPNKIQKARVFTYLQSQKIILLDPVFSNTRLLFIGSPSPAVTVLTNAVRHQQQRFTGPTRQNYNYPR